jgi:nucleotide-binding universal stress UspA family protein
MFQRILVPLDGSEHAEQALPIAARIAHASRGSLLLVRVADISADPALQFPEPLIDLEEVLKTERASATAYLGKVRIKVTIPNSLLPLNRRPWRIHAILWKTQLLP